MQLIFGIGKTGLSVAKFFAKNNINFTIADDDKQPKLLTQCLAYNPSYNYCGLTTDINFNNIKRAIISPGIAKDNKFIIKLQQNNIPIISDIDIFAQYAKAPIVAITGSNGKSSVVHLIAYMAEYEKIKVAKAGNIGTPALDILADDVELYILELSSYQLDYLHNINLAIALVLNISPDHLDRYNNFNDYINSKLSIYQYSKIKIAPSDAEFIPKEFVINTTYGLNIPKHTEQFGSVVCHNTRFLLQGDTILMSEDDTKLIGEHNIYNILASLTVGYKLNFSVDNMILAIKQFTPVKHRLEIINATDNIYYNDSKATNTTATIAAVDAILNKYRQQKLAIILGGIPKQEDYQALANKVNQVFDKIIIIGKAKKIIGSLFSADKTIYANSMLNAVQLAKKSITKGVILLSPACASFDMFSDFNNRGDEFKKVVQYLDTM